MSIAHELDIDSIRYTKADLRRIAIRAEGVFIRNTLEPSIFLRHFAERRAAAPSLRLLAKAAHTFGGTLRFSARNIRGGSIVRCELIRPSGFAAAIEWEFSDSTLVKIRRLVNPNHKTDAAAIGWTKCV